MRILGRRTKLVVFGFLMFLLGYFTVNIFHTNLPLIITDKPPPKPPNPPPPQNIRPVAINLEQHEIEAPLLIDETDKKRIDKDEIASNQNNSVLVIQDDKRKKKRYLAFDGGGLGSVNTGVVRCESSGLEVEITSSQERWKEADIFYFHMSAPNQRPNPNGYVMVYTMESEVHSYGGESWSQADFKMWYNLEESYPEPATYFDVRTHLAELLSKPRVSFGEKESEALVVWVVSNCNAYNGREKYMKRLMELASVHSYGLCLRNRFNHTSEHMKGNIELFSRYKFVIAIENSNCDDYVTEKLVHAVASGSIPIVAGRANKPDYLKFMPKQSYINIYDFKTVEDLAKHLKDIASSQVEYEKYIGYKFKHNYTREELLKKPLNELIDVAKEVLGYENERTFFDGIIGKEKSENKLCKLARHLNTKSKETLAAEITAHRANRPNSTVACLNRNNFAHDFNLA